MSLILEDKNRVVLPRCLEYSTASSLGLLRTVRQVATALGSYAHSPNATNDWIANPTLPTAVDVVAEALIVRDFRSDEATAAAEYILKWVDPSNALVWQLAHHFRETTQTDWAGPRDVISKDDRYEYISGLKKRVRLHPVDPIAWSDLALHYATLSQLDKARTAMNVALGLADGNRFVLRTASRSFAHMGEPDRAVWALRRSGRCDVDPWIAAAEIAVSEAFELKSRCIGRARHLIDDDNLAHFARSELTSAVATVEWNSGSVKSTRKLMQQALSDPTENALAQVEWLSNRIDGDYSAIETLRMRVPASYEAQALYSYYNRQFKESLEAAKMWSRYVYLSSRPIVMSSYIAGAILNDDAEAIRICRRCTAAQLADPAVLNNYAFALARNGEIAEAVDMIEKAKCYQLSDRQKLIVTATEGLLAFRSHDTERGRLLYAAAVKGFERAGELRNAAVATYYFAAEEKRIASQYAETKIREAKRGIEQHHVFELEDLARQL